MKKKILCLAMCAIMVASLLVGCGEKSRDELMNKIGEDTSEGAVTLTMQLLAEDAVSKEQEELIENAVNDILDTYNIKLDIKYYTIDNYYKVLEENFEIMKDFYNGNKKGTATREPEEPAYTDAENGLPVTYYPPNEEFQIDIFYFSGYDRYLDYKNNGYLNDFSARLVDSASKLKGGVNSILYENVNTVNGKYDMMPVNAPVGEYTYMLVDKDVLESTNYTMEDISSPVSDACADLLSMVDKSYPDYTPLYSSEGVLAFDGIKFFGTDENGFDNGDFSLLAGAYDSSKKYGEVGAYPEMSAMPEVVKEQIKRLKDYEFKGYYADENEESPFAVGYIKGDLGIIEEYSDDYEIMVVEAPRLTTEALYENAMAISAFTSDASKSARVLAELYANEELINILVNGIEGENYIWTNSDILDENDNPYEVIEKQAKEDKFIYNIDPYTIGNVAKVYPTVDDDPTRAQKIFDQNADAKADLLLGFSFYGSKIDLQPLDKIAELSADVKEKILNAKNQAELDEVFKYIDEIVAGEDMKKIFEGEKTASSYYTSWLKSKKLIAEE